jgi:hypothetical protein
MGGNYRGASPETQTRGGATPQQNKTKGYTGGAPRPAPNKKERNPREPKNQYRGGPMKQRSAKNKAQNQNTNIERGPIQPQTKTGTIGGGRAGPGRATKPKGHPDLLRPPKAHHLKYTGAVEWCTPPTLKQRVGVMRNCKKWDDKPEVTCKIMLCKVRVVNQWPPMPCPIKEV